MKERNAKWIGIFSLIVVAVLAVLPSASAKSKKVKKLKCFAEIISPEKGSTVGLQKTISGKAQLPSNGKGHLWIMAHREGLEGQWWPQGGHAAHVNSDGEWSVTAYLGEPRDIGSNFEIATVIVDSDTNKELQAWVNNASTTNDWSNPPSFPDNLSICEPPHMIKVKKTRH